MMEKMMAKKMVRKNRRGDAYVENLHEIILDLMRERDELKELISKQDEAIDTQHNFIRSLEKENEALLEILHLKEMEDHSVSNVIFDINTDLSMSVRK